MIKWLEILQINVLFIFTNLDPSASFAFCKSFCKSVALSQIYKKRRERWNRGCHI